MKSLSRVRLFATPWTVAYQAPPSMGFSRQEHWSGVPLPLSCVQLCNPMDYSPPGSPVHGIPQARILGCVAIRFSRGSSQYRDGTQVSWFEGRFFTISATREINAEIRSKHKTFNLVSMYVLTHQYHPTCLWIVWLLLLVTPSYGMVFRSRIIMNIHTWV